MGWTAPVIPKLQDPEQTPLPSEVSETETSLIGSILYVGTIVGPYLSGYLCNALGRKPCFYLAGLFSIISFLLLATANNLSMIYVGRVFNGFGIIPGTLIGEMFHSNVRSTGSTVSATIGWLFGFGLTTIFGYMVSELGSHITFWIFSGMCALAFLFTLVFVPETKGKTLDEIQFMLNK
ncbi:unnamed protein product, partial [Iphiclides podalirius]